jgi:rSAM/selenodomain-associated transferase 1
LRHNNSILGGGFVLNILGIFAKHWTPGQVKTRIGTMIGSDSAMRIYRAMLETSLRRLAIAGDHRSVLCWPPESISEFAEIAGPDWQIRPQHPGDLSVRLTGFFTEAFQTGAARVIAIGADCPELDCRRIENAFSMLDSNRVVLGPANDGGYYLVGMREPAAWLFDGIDWSTDRVWEQTCQKLSERSINWGKLPPMNDVDDTNDLIRLCDRLAKSDDTLDQQLLRRLKMELAGIENVYVEQTEYQFSTNHQQPAGTFPSSFQQHSNGGVRE